MIYILGVRFSNTIVDLHHFIVQGSWKYNRLTTSRVYVLSLYDIGKDSLRVFFKCRKVDSSFWKHVQ